MNLFKKIYCRIYQSAFHLALPLLPYREPKILNRTSEIVTEIKKLKLKKVLIITDEVIPEIKKEDIPLMAKHADKEGNPLYPVPVLLNAKELERFYYISGGIK